MNIRVLGGKSAAGENAACAPGLLGGVDLMKASIVVLFLLAFGFAFAVPLRAQTALDPADLPQRDGSHDFDFLVGDWKAHVRRLPDRLNKSSVWVEYDGISNHKKLL